LTGKRLARTAIGVVVVAVVAYFFWKSLSKNWASLTESGLSLGWWAAIAVVLFVIAVAISGWLWGRIVAELQGAPLASSEAIRVHYASWLLKYVPGQAGFVLNKVAWGKSRGISRLLVLLSVVYENAFLLLGSTVPMLAILLLAQVGRSASGPSSTVWFAIAAVIPLAAVTHPALFRRAVNALGRRVLKRDVPAEYFLPTRAALGYQLAFLAPRVVNGVAIAIIAAALADAPADSWVPLGAAYAIAGAVGILAVFVPSGLGVRESVFVLFATPYLSVEQAIIVALAARVLTTIADAGIAGIYGVMTLAKRNKEKP